MDSEKSQSTAPVNMVLDSTGADAKKIQRMVNFFNSQNQKVILKHHTSGNMGRGGFSAELENPVVHKTNDGEYEKVYLTASELLPDYAIRALYNEVARLAEDKDNPIYVLQDAGDGKKEELQFVYRAPGTGLHLEKTGKTSMNM